MKVESKRICLLHTSDMGTKSFAQIKKCTECSINVEPQPLIPTQASQFLKVIGRTCVHRAGIPDHTQGTQTGLPVGSDHLLQSIDLYTELVVDRHMPQ